MLAVTSIVITHELPAGTVPPVRLTPADPAANTPPALFCRVPAHVLVVVNGVATVIAAGVVGKVSVKATPVSATLAAFDSVMVSVDLVPGPMLLGENDLATIGRAVSSTAVLEGAPAAPVWVEETPVVVFEYVPTTAELTDTVIVQDAFAASVPAVSPMLVLPAAPPVIAPPQELVRR